MSSLIKARKSGFLGKNAVLQLGAIILSRLCLNTARRFAYPFAPALGRGMKVPVTAVTSIIAVSQATTILSPVFGPLADRMGYRPLMLTGLFMTAAGMLVGGGFPFYGFIMLALIMAMLGKSIFDPSIHAYVGEKVPFSRRGMAVGIIELSWSGSALIGIPLIGLVMGSIGWRAPFFILGGTAFISALAVVFFIPAEVPERRRRSAGTIFPEAWRIIFKKRAVLGTLCFGFLISAANDNLFVTYGLWLESAFGLSLAALGTATVAIGMAELFGEGLAAFISDRVGLKESVMAGLIFSAFGYLLLPTAENSLPIALTVLFIIFLAFEFTVITSLSLCTELLTGARATMMSMFIAIMGLGRVVGAMIGAPMWLAGKVAAVGLVSSALSILAVIFLYWGLRGWQSD